MKRRTQKPEEAPGHDQAPARRPLVARGTGLLFVTSRYNCIALVQAFWGS